MTCVREVGEGSTQTPLSATMSITLMWWGMTISATGGSVQHRWYHSWSWRKWGSWEYLVVLLKKFTVKIISYCSEYKCRFSKQRYLFLYLIQSRMRFGTCSTSFDSIWKGNEVRCIHHNFTLCQNKRYNRINLLHVWRKWKFNDNSLFAFSTSINDRKKITSTVKHFLQIVAHGEHVYQANIWNFRVQHTGFISDKWEDAIFTLTGNVWKNYTASIAKENDRWKMVTDVTTIVFVECLSGWIKTCHWTNWHCCVINTTEIKIAWNWKTYHSLCVMDVWRQ